MCYVPNRKGVFNYFNNGYSEKFQKIVYEQVECDKRFFLSWKRLWEAAYHISNREHGLLPALGNYFLPQQVNAKYDKEFYKVSARAFAYL